MLTLYRAIRRAKQARHNQRPGTMLYRAMTRQLDFLKGQIDYCLREYRHQDNRRSA
mgnify:CR=1 FL=1